MSDPRRPDSKIDSASATAARAEKKTEGWGWWPLSFFFQTSETPASGSKNSNTKKAAKSADSVVKSGEKNSGNGGAPSSLSAKLILSPSNANAIGIVSSTPRLGLVAVARSPEPDRDIIIDVDQFGDSMESSDVQEFAKPLKQGFNLKTLFDRGSVVDMDLTNCSEPFYEPAKLPLNTNFKTVSFAKKTKVIPLPKTRQRLHRKIVRSRQDAWRRYGAILAVHQYGGCILTVTPAKCKTYTRVEAGTQPPPPPPIPPIMTEEDFYNRPLITLPSTTRAIRVRNRRRGSSSSSSASTPQENSDDSKKDCC